MQEPYRNSDGMHRDFNSRKYNVECKEHHVPYEQWEFHRCECGSRLKLQTSESELIGCVMWTCKFGLNNAHNLTAYCRKLSRGRELQLGEGSVTVVARALLEREGERKERDSSDQHQPTALPLSLSLSLSLPLSAGKRASLSLLLSRPSFISEQTYQKVLHHHRWLDT